MSIKSFITDNNTLSPILWFWIPFIWFAGQLLIEVFLPTDTILYLHKESGPHEILQFLLISASCIIFLRTLLKNSPKLSNWLKAWLMIAIICSFYVASEEISWGQSFFQWSTPEHWQKINNQNETNLHNTSRLLNQIPRYGLMVGILVGGLIIPILQQCKDNLLPKKLEIIYPPMILSFLTVLLIIVTLGHKMSKMFLDTKMFERSSEVEEIFMFFFIFLYAIILKKRIAEK